MKNLILTTFFILSVLTSIVLLIMKYTWYIDVSFFNAVFFAFIPNLSAFIPNMAVILFNRFEAFVNTILNLF